MQTDLIILGAGHAGMSAAISALNRGLKVTLIDKNTPGEGFNFDLQDGKVATISLLSETNTAITSGPSIWMDPGIKDVFSHHYLEFVKGWGRVVRSNTVEVAGNTYSARKLIIATGSEAYLEPANTFANIYLYSEDALPPVSDLSQGVVIAGGGEYACLIAEAYSSMGIVTNLVVPGAVLLEEFESEVSDLLQDSYAKLGIGLYLNSSLVSATKVADAEGPIKVRLNDTTVLMTSAIISTGTRRGRTDGMGLESIGCATDERGFVKVNRRLQSSRTGIFCAGDVTGMLLGPVSAREMGRIAVSQAFDRSPVSHFNPMQTARVVPTTPLVAAIGRKEGNAPRKSSKVEKVAFEELPSPRFAPASTGFVKLVTAPRPFARRLGGGRLIGATIVGNTADEMMAELALIIRRKLPIGAIVENLRPTRSLSYSVELAARRILEYSGSQRSKDD